MMYNEFIFYINKWIDLRLFFSIILYAAIVLIIFFMALYSSERYKRTLERAIDKWHNNKELTEREEMVLNEYQEF